MTISSNSDILKIRNMQLQSTAIIRDRGQLTIPDLIRGRNDWVSPGSVVTVLQTGANEIVIKPHAEGKKVNWDKLWKNIELTRSYEGSYSGSLSEFIALDRESH